MRKVPPPDSSLPKVREKRLREMKDLSFLKGQNTGPEGQERYCIYQAQFSCVVCGLDEWQWVVYGFIDTKHNGDDDGDARQIKPRPLRS